MVQDGCYLLLMQLNFYVVIIFIFITLYGKNDTNI